MARKSRKGVAVVEQPKKPVEKVWRAALYIRLSVEFNGKRGDSLETQRQIMEAYITLCPDIEIVGVYTDNGITGRTFEREAFQRMLHDVEDGKVDCIVVKDLSRLGRNTIDTGYYIEKYFSLHGVRFIAVNDRFDSEDSENSGNHLIVPLKNMINEAYAADISKKVRAQQNQAMRDGEFVGARPPYGYRKDPDNCHHLLVNEDTAPIVRQIFQWTVDGVPLNEVVKRLNEGGVMTPGYYLAHIGLITSQRLMGSGKWQTWTVGKILDSEVYIGDMVQGKHTNVGHQQVLTKPEDWIVVRDTHEPIISREMFAQAQTVRGKAAKRDTPCTAKVPYTENILRGRVFCGCCGKNLHRQRHQCGYYFYHCISNDRIGKSAFKGELDGNVIGAVHCHPLNELVYQQGGEGGVFVHRRKFVGHAGVPRHLPLQLGLLHLKPLDALYRSVDLLIVICLHFQIFRPGENSFHKTLMEASANSPIFLRLPRQFVDLLVHPDLLCGDPAIVLFQTQGFSHHNRGLLPDDSHDGGEQIILPYIDFGVTGPFECVREVLDNE